MIRAAILCALLAGNAHAGMTTHDQWTGEDKVKHAAAGFVIGASVTAATENVGYGIAAGIIVGAIKEYNDMRQPMKHTSSLQDLLVTAAGAAVGANLAGFVITYSRGRTGVAYSRSF